MYSDVIRHNVCCVDWRLQLAEGAHNKHLGKGYPEASAERKYDTNISYLLDPDSETVILQLVPRNG